MSINRLVLIFAASLPLVALPAGAAVVFNNLTGVSGASSGGAAFISSTGHNGPLGDSFSTGAGTSTLTDVMLALDATTPTDGGSFAIDLFSNNGATNTPLTLLATLGTINDSALTSSIANSDVPVAGSVNLAANTRYWIELVSTSSSAKWSYTSTNVGIGVANEYNFFAGSSSLDSAFTPYQMEVTSSAPAVTGTPEPAAVALTAIGFAGLAVLRRGRA